MKYEPQFVWDEENGSALCVIQDEYNTFTGYAQCHENDTDMKSEKTGCEIAYRRARIKYFRHGRDVLKNKLEALNQLYYSMNKSKQFNSKSYENKMLQRQIRLTKFDLDTIKEMLATEEQSLREYLQKKDNFYNAVRRRRESRAD